MLEDHDKFSAHNPKLQIMWSPSSLGLYMRDPALYHLERVEGWRVEPPPINVVFGRLYHSALEEYDRLCLRADPDYAVEQAVRKAWREALEPVQGWSLDDIASLSSKPAEQARNTESLIRSIIWYHDEGHGLPSDPVQPIRLGGEEMVEVEFQIPLDIYSPYGEQYMIGGVLDGIVSLDEEVYVRERKTTSATLGPYYKSQFDIDPQIDTYALASYMHFGIVPKGVLIEATQIGKTFSRFGRFFQSRTPSQIEEWKQDLCYWIKRAEFDAEQGFWPCNRATTSLYGGHPLYDVIARPSSVRDGLLRQGFVKERRQEDDRSHH